MAGSSYDQWISDYLPWYQGKLWYGGVLVDDDVSDWRVTWVSHKWGTRPVKQSRPKPVYPLLAQTSLGPYSKNVATTVRAQWHQPRHSVGWGYEREGTNYWYGMPYSDVVLDQPAGLIARHNKKVRRVSDDYSQAVAEIHKSADGFLDAAKMVAKIANRLRKGRLPKEWKKKHPNRSKDKDAINIGDAGSAILAFQFGIRPVVQDVYTTVNRVETVLDGLTRIHTRERRSQYESYEQFVRTDQVISYVRRSTVNPSNLGNPAEWLWENIPFSFVVDYMFNVGDTIAAFGAGQGLDHFGTTTALKQTSRLTPGTHESVVPAGYVITDPGKLERTLYQRVLSSDLPVPSRIALDASKSWEALLNATSTLIAIDPKRWGGRYTNPRRW